jgi:DNA-binding MarR family transcriptional regulator
MADQNDGIRMSNRVSPKNPRRVPPVPLATERWLPHQCAVVANRVSGTLERMYGGRYGLSVTGWRIMAILGAKAPLSSKELSAELAIGAVAVSRAIDELVSAGLVARRAAADDRRRHALRLSAKGRRIYDEIVPLARGVEQALLGTVAPADRKVLERVMAKLATASAEILADDRDWHEFLG